jgi:hypothetical protein
MPRRDFRTTLLLQTLRAIVQSLDGDPGSMPTSCGGVEFKETLKRRIALIESCEPSTFSLLKDVTHPA